MTAASLTMGVLTGLLAALFAISYASLIFAGPLGDAVTIGVGLTLAGTIILNLVVAWRGEIPGEVAKIQDIPVALLATTTAGLAASLPATVAPEARTMTVLALIVVTSAVVGFGFWVLGQINLGNLVWYFPFPVTAGFLAGVGWLLIVGAIGLMTGVTPGLTTILSLLTPEMLWRWMPGALFGVCIFLLARRIHSPYMMPLALAIGGGLFYLVLSALGLDQAAAHDRGLLLGPFAPGMLWSPPPIAGIRLIDWPLVFAQSGTILTIFVVTLLGQLLDATGLEMTVDHPLDLNRELRTNGLGNILIGLLGSPPGHMSLSLSSLAIIHGGFTRFTPLITALACLLLLFFGAPILSVIPVFLLAGLIVSLGLTFLAQWLIGTWNRVSRLEYGVILAIFVAIQLLGVLSGVAIGLLLALLIFVISYSRVSVIKHSLDGTTFRSNVERPQYQIQQLAHYGRELLILELQGFIFFGTVVKLQERINSYTADHLEQDLRFVVMDFRQVQGLDASAVAGFAKLRSATQRRQITLVLTDLDPGMQARLLGPLEDSDAQSYCRVLPDLDRGVEWCEEQLLRQLMQDLQPAVSQQETIFQNLQLGFSVRDRLDRYLEKRTFAPGDYLIHQGTSTAGIVFILAGSASVQLEYDDRQSVRVRKAGPGAVFGEMSTYAGTLTSAAVIADEETVAYILSPAGLAALEKDDPATASKFHQAIAALMGERLAEATATIRALLE